MDFFEVPGGLWLRFQPVGFAGRGVEPTALKEGCCLFATYQWGTPKSAEGGNAEPRIAGHR
jgi:hypothetical protein